MMERSATALLLVLAGIGGSSLLYFLCLPASVPFWLFLAILAAGVVPLWGYLYHSHMVQHGGKTFHIDLAIIIAGVFLITNRTYHLAMPDGGWDAWGIWNYHARFLADKKEWQNVFLSTQYDHPDYPLCLSGTIAWMTRLFGRGHTDLVSFGLHFWITGTIPLLIFCLLRRKNIWIAGLMLIFFATNDFYLNSGISQYADTLLAAFLLAAVVSARFAQTDRRMLALAAFFAGCMAWTKNEGLVLAILFMLLYANIFFRKNNLLPFLAGIAFPATVLFIFKVFYAPGNDMTHSLGNIIVKLKDPERYSLIWRFFLQNGKDYFLPVVWLLVAYIIACAWKRRMPDKGLLLILGCLIAYLFIYLLTPYDLQWHLQTSQDRLMHQLMPATVYILADGLADMICLRKAAPKAVA
jgi:hypothetical protein